MFDEMVFDTLTRYLLNGFKITHTIDFPVDYELAERISLLREVDFYLEENADEKKKKLVGALHCLTDTKKDVFFPELSGFHMHLPYLLYELKKKDNIDEKTSYAAVVDITKQDDYKSFFSKNFQNDLVKIKKEQIATSAIFCCFHNSLNLGDFVISMATLKDKIFYTSIFSFKRYYNMRDLCFKVTLLPNESVSFDGAPQCLHVMESRAISSLQYLHAFRKSTVDKFLLQCLHKIAATLIFSALNGHFLVSDMVFSSRFN